jgi:dihydroorotase
MRITLNDPLDMHLHLRDGDMCKIVSPLSAQSFSGALVMPNLVPPVTTIERVKEYKSEILQNIKDERFEPFMSLFFLSSYDKKFLQEAKESILAIKLYPAGITTNSEGGISGFDLDEIGDTLEAMSELGLPLCVHGESNGFVMDRESEFGEIYKMLSTNFPKLKIIMEHITTKNSVDLLEKYDNLYATITLHHLLITLDDVAGGLLSPHLFCKPIAKRPEDRDALLSVALRVHEKVMFGSDSAPHPRNKKECSGCAAGVFTAPIALEVLCELFESHGKLENLQAFVSDNAKAIYNISPPKKEVILAKKAKKIAKSYDIVVPFWAKREISWSIEEIK